MDTILTVNLPHPIPDMADVNTHAGSFDIKRYSPDAFFCYARPNAMLDTSWPARSTKDPKITVLEIVHQHMTSKTDPPKDEQEYFGGIPLWFDQYDAVTIPDNQDWEARLWWNGKEKSFYNLRGILLQDYHRRRFSAGWHPNVRIWDPKKEVKLLDQINMKAKSLSKAKKEWKEMTKKRHQRLK